MSSEIKKKTLQVYCNFFSSVLFKISTMRLITLPVNYKSLHLKVNLQEDTKAKFADVSSIEWLNHATSNAM